tara:strand:- start:5180 stop:5629 length:450 start_codon:yes stop_codon:yes gene_type:complete
MNLKNIIIVIFLFFFTPLNSSEIFISLKKEKVNVRYGPSFESPIKYIYKKKNLPIKQIDQKENFRRVIDLKNNSGWIHISQLKKINSLIILEDKILFKKPTNYSKPLARIKKGKVLIVKKCNDIWCKIQSGKFKGWIRTNNVWGLKILN